MKFQYGDIVRNKNTGKIGVITPQMVILQEDGPFSFVAEGDNTGMSIADGDPNYKIIGHYTPQPTMEGCGAGKGREACVFGGVGADGLMCLRFTSHHWYLMGKRDMGAKRAPGALFPACFTDRSRYLDE